MKNGFKKKTSWITRHNSIHIQSVTEVKNLGAKKEPGIYGLTAILELLPGAWSYSKFGKVINLFVSRVGLAQSSTCCGLGRCNYCRVVCSLTDCSKKDFLFLTSSRSLRVFRNRYLLHPAWQLPVSLSGCLGDSLVTLVRGQNFKNGKR